MLVVQRLVEMCVEASGMTLGPDMQTITWLTIWSMTRAVLVQINVHSATSSWIFPRASLVAVCQPYLLPLHTVHPSSRCAVLWLRWFLAGCLAHLPRAFTWSAALPRCLLSAGGGWCSWFGGTWRRPGVGIARETAWVSCIRLGWFLEAGLVMASAALSEEYIRGQASSVAPPTRALTQVFLQGPSEAGSVLWRSCYLVRCRPGGFMVVLPFQEEVVLGTL